MRWFFPSWNGDFRLLPDGEQRCRLEVVDPTVGERTMLNGFLTAARKSSWLRDGRRRVRIGEGRQNFELDAPMSRVGTMLLAYTKPHDRTLTAVVFESGKIKVEHSYKETSTLIAKAVAPKAKDKGKAATSTERPTPSCPQCVRGSVDRASEVLLSFLNEREHAEWADRRAITVTGGRSGHRYLVAHRHSALAHQFGRLCYDLDDRGVLHFHNWALPPEEEVLSTKLILEHREPWLRNEATCLITDVVGGGGRNMPGVGHWRDVFKNPFGDITDGIDDASLTTFIGSFTAAMLNVPEWRAAADDELRQYM